MIESELLLEKYRVQRKLAQESVSVKDYLRRSHLAAEEIAKSRNFTLRYTDVLPRSKAADDKLGEAGL